MSGFLEQTDGGEYRHSKFSRAYRLDEPGPGHMFLACYDHVLSPFHNFVEYLSQRGQLPSNAREPDDPLHSPMTHHYNQDGVSPWSTMEQNPERMRDFQFAMDTLGEALPVVGTFDFRLLRNEGLDESRGRVQLVDVGGGHGTVLGGVLAAYGGSSLRPETCVLQDRPGVVELSRRNRALPDAVQRMNHDFFTDQPVKGAKAYLMRAIIHDWPDAACVKILTHLAAAMAPDSRVLICDPVLPPRLGEDNFFIAIVDHAVMALAGKERTEKAFSDLLDQAGLELVRVWRVSGGAQIGACVEGRLKRQSSRL
ncbi:hypothetical protein L249_4323 [Ophiocordyceps polyrhachis-furcata BCC 54312]|uniref:O-methyltransferase C-terminal domain-containing protein n=1 Tax=Ophiocordyceps polyrhachis-furcata BCC 54312 TaxID=1330021 RepID=A0A367L813_9HYPO|nr:hypothetical protein L249_4323 [Ophiocordyceps polyrhachis-furcata BCC 54312]